jgi:hypothetical protein
MRFDNEKKRLYEAAKETEELVQVTMSLKRKQFEHQFFFQSLTASTREVFEERSKLTLVNPSRRNYDIKIRSIAKTFFFALQEIADRRLKREAEQKQFVGQCRELNQVATCLIDFTTMTNASRRIFELKFRSSGFDCFRRK